MFPQIIFWEIEAETTKLVTELCISLAHYTPKSTNWTLAHFHCESASKASGMKYFTH